MNTKVYLFLILTSTFFLFDACSSNDDAPGSKVSPLNFDKTEKTIDYEMQDVVFTSDRKDCFISHIREVQGSDTLGYSTANNENEGLKGEWYKINVDNYVITVEISENQNDKTRELILNIVAGDAGKTLKIIQNKN